MKSRVGKVQSSEQAEAGAPPAIPVAGRHTLSATDPPRAVHVHIILIKYRLLAKCCLNLRTKQVLNRMIGRRNIRVKVMQTLYTLATTGVTSLDEQKKHGAGLLEEKISRFLDLFVISVLYTLKVAQYAEKDAGKRAAKYLPTTEDLNVSTKIAGNEFLWKILNNETFIEKIKDKHISRYIDDEQVRK